MRDRVLTLTIFWVLILANLLGLPALAKADPITVTTFRTEFINWATPHEADFTFPEQQLYSEVLCHMTIACPSGEADCDPWDRFGNLKIRHHIDEENFEDFEIARFITPYDITFTGGPQTCSWTTDVTDYQFMLHDEVTLRLYIESWMGNDNGWLVTIQFEMLPGQPDREPFSIVPLWRTGNLIYGDPDNPSSDHLTPISVTVPEQASWAKVRTFSTGHSFWNTDNAAEFSYKWQQVSVDGNDTQHYLWRSDCATNRCSPQQGTWQYNRAGWCPGDKAEAWNVDISDLILPGQESVFGFALQPYENICRPNNPDCIDYNGCECAGHAFYKLESQVVFYRVPNNASAVDGTLIPGKLHLVGNHPNPFNPTTTIQYHLAEPGDVTIAVYDAQGKVVCKRDFTHSSDGGYTWTWNGRGITGELLSSGIYLYEIRHGQERVSSKMVLLK